MEPQGNTLTAKIDTSSRAANARFSADLAKLLAYYLALSVICLQLGLMSGSGDMRGLTIYCVIFISALLSSIAGFAFSAIAAALCFYLPGIDHLSVIKTLLIASLANQSFATFLIRGSINWRRLPRFLAGGVVGIPLGVYLLTHLDAKFYTAGIGVFLIAFGVYSLLRKRARPTISGCRFGDITAGLLGGIAGGFAAIPGVVVAVWCNLRGWNKMEQRAVLQPFILAMQFITLTHMSALSGEVIFFSPECLGVVPASLAGTAIGLRIFHRMTDETFRRMLMTLLIVSGCGLLVPH